MQQYMNGPEYIDIDLSDDDYHVKEPKKKKKDGFDNKPFIVRLNLFSKYAGARRCDLPRSIDEAC